MILHLDTHILVWLYDACRDRFSERAAAAIDAARELRTSPMAVLELGFLREIGRIRDPAPVIMDLLQADFGVTVCPHPWTAVVAHAHAVSWTRDPFDRLIVAHAAAVGAPLLTADRRILDQHPEALW